MIRTERLKVRRVREDDWREIGEIWAETAKTPFARFDSPNDTSDEAVKLRIERWASFADSSEHMFFAICLDETVIGYVSLHQRDDAYELGYCFHPNYHGQGFARESISALSDMMKMRETHKIIARTALNNTPSVSLLVSLGFAQTGKEKVSFYRDADGNDIYFNGGIYELQL